MDMAIWALAGVIVAAALVVLARWRQTRGAAHRGESADEARLEAARAALAQARTEAVATVAQARTEAVATREAALDELTARRAAVEEADRRIAGVDHELRERRTVVDERRAALDERRATLDAERDALEAQRAITAAALQAAAGLDRESAVASVLDRVDAELAVDHGGRVQRAVAERVGDVGPTARMRIADAIQRHDTSHADGAPRGGSLALEDLSDEEREQLVSALVTVAESTATELGIDAERNAATLRGLDPIGREVARQASLEVLERRLRATEVPPLLARTRTTLGRRIIELGERALWEMQLGGRPELAELLGTLHYRFSYGQNALLHCQETGYLCAMLASELRMDTAEGRAAGLLHDIGKAVDHDVEGSHAIIGGELLTILGTDLGIVHAVKAHHFDEEPTTDLAMLTICADAISASRPGARRDTLTTYLARLEQLQQIATRHRGVERAFPMQAGREVRVSVRPDTVPDAQVPQLCAEIAREIESEMTYPGMIKVTVIRETSASATAS